MGLVDAVRDTRRHVGRHHTRFAEPAQKYGTDLFRCHGALRHSTRSLTSGSYSSSGAPMPNSPTGSSRFTAVRAVRKYADIPMSIIMH